MASITLKDHKLLWGRGGNRCAYCKKPLVIEETDLDAASVVGEEAHIVGEKLTSPRGDDPLPLDERNKYSNLVLLCNIHHKMVDDQTATYPIQVLHDMKIAHEKWVDETLSSATDKQGLRDDLVYIDIIMEWDRQMNLADWRSWTSNWFHGGDPGMPTEELERLFEAKTFLFNRLWPKTNEELEEAFGSFRQILNDLLRLFSNFAGEPRGGWLHFEKFYKRGGRYNPNYDKDHGEYLFYINAFEDLGLELTRCGNQICDIVRKTIHPAYRRAEGALLVMVGPTMKLEYVNHRPEYQPGEKYRGLLAFYNDRKTRDICMVQDHDPEPENPFR